jgi:hypothetical protein
MVSAKQWMKHDDIILRFLAHGVVNRQLPKVEISRKKFDKKTIDLIKEKTKKKYNINDNDIQYLVSGDIISNSAYTDKNEKIHISFSNNVLKDMAEVSDILNISYLNETVKKYYICYPKDCGI